MLGIKTAALPASLRRTNQRTIISLLWRMGTASRADLAKAAGLSQPTAGKITTELLQLGVLQVVSPGAEEKNGNGSHPAPRLGRPGQLLRLDSDRLRFVAIQLGVLETSVAALPVGLRPDDDWSHRFATPATPAAWVAALRKVAAQIPRDGLWGVLISVPGIVDETAGKVVFSPNLHWLETVDLPGLVAEVWDMPVLLVQEIRALALGHLVAEPIKEDFLLVDFGQGVGGAIVLDGQLFAHPTALGGELGHTPVPGNPRPCGCGAFGCLETLVSRRGLLDSFSATGHHPARVAVDGEAPAPDGEENWRSKSHPAAFAWTDLVRHVGDHGMEPWLVNTLNTTAKVIAGALNVLGVHRVVMTGSLAELPPCVLEYLAREVKQGAMWARFGEVVCQPAPRRRAAGLVASGINRLVLPAGDEPEARLPKLSGSITARRAFSLEP